MTKTKKHHANKKGSKKHSKRNYHRRTHRRGGRGYTTGASATLAQLAPASF